MINILLSESFWRCWWNRSISKGVRLAWWYLYSGGSWGQCRRIVKVRGASGQSISRSWNDRCVGLERFRWGRKEERSGPSRACQNWRIGPTRAGKKTAMESERVSCVVTGWGLEMKLETRSGLVKIGVGWRCFRSVNWQGLEWETTLGWRGFNEIGKKREAVQVTPAKTGTLAQNGLEKYRSKVKQSFLYSDRRGLQNGRLKVDL